MKLQERLAKPAKLAGGVVVILVGAPSEAESARRNEERGASLPYSKSRAHSAATIVRSNVVPVDFAQPVHGCLRENGGELADRKLRWKTDQSQRNDRTQTLS